MQTSIERPLLPKVESNGSRGNNGFDHTTADSPGGSGGSGWSREPPGKRKCISSACMPCRARKSKCDGARPSCMTCTTMYGTNCLYDLDSDRRRKGALKRDISTLKKDLNSRDLILNAIRVKPDSEVDDLINLIRTNPNKTFDELADSIQQMELTRQRADLSSLGGLEGELRAGFSTKSSSDTTGAVGHYGYTSNLAFGQERRSNSIPGEQLGDWTSVTNDPELFDHLLSVYFSWSHPIYLLFSEETFIYGLQERKLKYCTPLLVNAIMAVACHFSDRPEARVDPTDPSTVGSHFFAEAKRLFAQDDRSCLTTVQALGLMSLKQAMSSSDNEGWQYAGQMISLSLQLALHQPDPPKNPRTLTEIEARRVTLWGVFILNSIWALCVGRISSLPRAAIRLEKPGLIDELEARLWKPHGQADFGRLPYSLEQPSCKYSLFVQHSLLSEIVDDIVQMFYAPKDRITSRKLQGHYENLQAWYKNVPEGLRVRRNGPTLPQVLTLHMSYHNCIIQLFRPFLILGFVQEPKSPRTICTESANEISELERLYSNTYGFRRPFFIVAHCIMSAAIIHLNNISKPAQSPTPSDPVYDHHVESLVLTIMHLQETEMCTALARRYLDSLATLIQKWCKHIPPRVRDAMSKAKMIPRSTPATTTPTVTDHPPIDSTTRPSMFLLNDIVVQDIFPPLPSPNSQGHLRPVISNPRKHSAPELVRMAPATSNIDDSINKVSPLSSQQQFFWTPFPGAPDGIPLTVPRIQRQNSSSGVSVTSMLDGDYPQLIQDGFTLIDSDDSQWGNWENVMAS